MKNHVMLRMLVSLVVGCLVGGQQARAQDNHQRPHFHKIVVPQQVPDSRTVRAQTVPAPNLHSLQATFIQDYPTIGANADGTDLWPCADLYKGVAGSSPDCPSLGNPSVPLPLGALVTGFSVYTWPLENTQGSATVSDATRSSTGLPARSPLNTLRAVKSLPRSKTTPATLTTTSCSV